MSNEIRQYLKTNYFYYLEKFFGTALIEAIPKLENIYLRNQSSKSKYFSQNFVTNPILRVFLICAKENGDTIRFDMSRLSGSDSDYVYLKFLGHLVNYLRDEIYSNKDYEAEIKKRLLSYNSGNFYSAYCELIIGGFLKHNGCMIKFNSSKQNGIPDVVVNEPIRFANEAKLFPDSEYWLMDKINNLKDTFLSFLKQFSNAEVIVLLTTVENFETDFPNLFSLFLRSGGKGQQNGSITIMRNSMYIGSQGYVIDYVPNNSKIRIIPSIPMRDEVIQKILDKSEEQFKNSGIKGITWISFPHPKGGAIERRIIGQVSELPNKFKKNNLGMVLYDFMPVSNIDTYRGGIMYALDAFLSESQLEFINNAEFGSFVKDISDKSTLLVS